MAVNEPVNWVIGGLGGLASVVTALALDPTGVVAALVMTVIQQAGTLFTVFSIFGFTVAPNVGTLEPYTQQLQAAALVLGVLFAATLLDRFWGNFTERFT